MNGFPFAREAGEDLGTWENHVRPGSRSVVFSCAAHESGTHLVGTVAHEQTAIEIEDATIGRDKR